MRQQEIKLEWILKCFSPKVSAFFFFSIYDYFNAKLSVVAQSCPTLCDPMDYSPPGSTVHGILQARILEWVAISFSRDFNASIKKL